MRKFFARLFITAFGLWLADVILDGVGFDSVISLWIAALLLGVVNAIVRPIVILLTLPITFVTLGLFLFIINGLMMLLVAWLMPQFHVASLASGVWASIIVGLTSWLANGLTGGKKILVARGAGQ